MSLTISPVAVLSGLFPTAPDKGRGGDAFAPLIATLGEAGPPQLPTGQTLPPPGQPLPLAPFAADIDVPPAILLAGEPGTALSPLAARIGDAPPTIPTATDASPRAVPIDGEMPRVAPTVAGFQKAKPIPAAAADVDTPPAILTATDSPKAGRTAPAADDIDVSPAILIAGHTPAMPVPARFAPPATPDVTEASPPASPAGIPSASPQPSATIRPAPAGEPDPAPDAAEVTTSPRATPRQAVTRAVLLAGVAASPLPPVAESDTATPPAPAPTPAPIPVAIDNKATRAATAGRPRAESRPKDQPEDTDDTTDSDSAPTSALAQPATPLAVAVPLPLEPTPRHPGLEPGSRFSPEADRTPVAAAPSPESIKDTTRSPIAAGNQGSGTPAQGRGDDATPLPTAAMPEPAAARPQRPTNAPAALDRATPPAPTAAKSPMQPAPAPFAAPAQPLPIASPPAVTPMTVLSQPEPTTTPPVATTTDPTVAVQQSTRATTPAGPATPPDPRAATPVVLPALQAFGAAMRQALADERRPARTVDDTAPTALPGLAATAPVTPLAPTRDAPALDMGDRRWPHAMAEQIERLREAANEQSTRIRLIPDALGPVDVAVRRDGEQVHVRFTAAQAETRQLLADAQPRLADAAEARGLKLGRTDVAGGDLAHRDFGGGERQQQRTPTHAPQSNRPAPARTRAAATDPTDTRIA